jgi:anti-anti-sigma factor
MQIVSKIADDYAVLSFDAELLVFQNPHGTELISACEKLFDQGINRIVLDLARVGIIGSSGISSMISLNNRINQDKGKFVMFNLNEDILELYKKTNLMKIFNVASSMADAISKLVE